MLSGASVLAATLDVFKHFYNEIAKSIYEFNDYYEQQSGAHDTR